MRRRTALMVLWMALFALSSGNLFAQERWVYLYNGYANGEDRANSIVMGTDGNLYAAGGDWATATWDDIVVISLTPSGDQRWIYRWSNGGRDEANSIVTGLDGNLYAAGYSFGGATLRDFTVISLTPSAGERWLYHYDCFGGGVDLAYSIAAGTDGNLYATGESESPMAQTDFIVVSLDTSGTPRWVYRYNGPAHQDDQARWIMMSTDGNLYVAGYSTGTSEDFTVVSLDTSGTERWVYRYNGPADSMDAALSIATGPDGNLYVAGCSWETGTRLDFTVISLDTSGTERWVYRYDGPAHSTDEACSIATGADGNLYVCGGSWGTGTRLDFTVISLDTSGTERWVYRYNGPGDYSDYASSIVAGADGNLYAAGRSTESGIYSDFTVISLDTSGAERWIYSYNGSADSLDRANSIFAGTDGNLYAAGYSSGSGTGKDFVVISLAGGARDVGTVSVDEPPDTVACADTVLVSATVCNYGDTLETFDVEAVIDSSNVVVYADTQTVVDLLPDSCGSVSFADWPVPPVHGVSYTVRVTTLFPLDINPRNDTASKEVLAWCPPGVEETVTIPVTPHLYALKEARPNPTRGWVKIEYQLPARSEISVRIYDLKGSAVRTLTEGVEEAGLKTVVWDGRDDRGEQVASGIYLYRLTACPEFGRGAGDPALSEVEVFAATRKLVVLQ